MGTLDIFIFFLVTSIYAKETSWSFSPYISSINYALLTEISLSVCLSVCMSVCLFLCVYVCLSVPLSISISLFLFFSLSLYSHLCFFPPPPPPPTPVFLCLCLFVIIIMDISMAHDPYQNPGHNAPYKKKQKNV